MAPLPVENTNRFLVDYVWRGIPHTVLYRWEVGQSIAGASFALDTFHNAVRAYFYNNWQVPGTGKWYATGSTIGLDVSSLDPLDGTVGVDPGSRFDAIQHQLLGRSSGGRRVSWFFSGAGFPTPANQRLQRADDSALNSTMTAFEALIGEGLVCIDGEVPLLKQYANIVVNDYLTQQSRRG